jgi:hypothetical protein
MQKVLRDLYKGFKYETEEELERKRKVYLSFIVNDEEEQAKIRQERGDVELNKACYDILSKIIQKRQRVRMREERFKNWVSITAPFLAGLVGVMLSPLAARVWNAIQAR